MMAANELGRGLAAYEALMRLIFGGTKDWDRDNHVRSALEAIGLDWEDLQERISNDEGRLRAAVLANDEAL
ncbi:MAG: hypothetical protein GWN83_19970, partial [Gemmatimonadetes bacterium]|nr:hypothetical protein [Gemmatimonadota bacterium]